MDGGDLQMGGNDGWAPFPSGASTARELALTDRDRLRDRLPRSSLAPSEYAFANLYLFRHRHHYRLIDGPAPCLSGITYDGRRHALPLAPLDSALAETLLESHDCLFPIDAEGRARAETLGLSWESMVADSDYIFDAQRMATLAGAKTRRSQARAFVDHHAPSYHPATPALVDELNGVLDGWLADVGRSPDHTDVVECREGIDQLDALGLEGALVRTGEGEPVAFLLATPSPHGEAIVHFAKGRRAHEGAYPWMFARYAAACGAERLNFEQDLGKPGFAQAKRAYGPIEHRPKYRLFRSR